MGQPVSDELAFNAGAVASVHNSLSMTRDRFEKYVTTIVLSNSVQRWAAVSARFGALLCYSSTGRNSRPNTSTSRTIRARSSGRTPGITLAFSALVRSFSAVSAMRHFAYPVQKLFAAFISSAISIYRMGVTCRSPRITAAIRAGRVSARPQVRASC